MRMSLREGRQQVPNAVAKQLRVAHARRDVKRVVVMPTEGLPAQQMSHHAPMCRRPHNYVRVQNDTATTGSVPACTTK